MLVSVKIVKENMDTGGTFSHPTSSHSVNQCEIQCLIQQQVAKMIGLFFLYYESAFPIYLSKESK